MSDVLVRGLPRTVHIKIQKLAASENLSVNQVFIRLIDQALRQKEGEESEEIRRAEAFERVRKLREKMHRLYGKQEDSAKLIREDRDSR